MVKISHTNIIVDQFSTARNNPFNKYVHFLTHIHTDHLKGLSNSWDYGPIYCSEVTQSLILLKYPRLKCLKVLQMEKQYTIQLSSQLQITVTMFDANHCAGGVMFLFQGYMGTVLYTGDIRFDKDVFSHYNYLYPHTRRNKQFKKCSIDIDFLYLDTTFLHPKFSFPPKLQALKSLDSYIEDTITKAKEQNKFIQFYIGIDSFGKQEVLVHLAQKFETLVTVSEERYKNISVIGLESEYFTTDADAGFIHVVLKRDMRQCMLGKQNSMGIILTGWANSAHNRSLNTYAIPYSLHSSYPELVQFVDSIRPCYIESILEVSLKRQSGQQRQQSNSRSNNTNRSSSLQKAGELKLAQKYTNPHSNSNNNKNTQQYQLYQQINTSQYLNKLRQQYTSKPSQQLIFLMTNTQFQQKIKQKLKLDRQSTQLNRQLQLSSSISNITRVQNVYRAGAKLNNERDQKEIQRLKQRVKSKRQSAAKNVLQKISISKNKNQPSKSTSLPNRQKQRQKKREPQQQGQRQQQQQQNKNRINIGRSRQKPYQIQDGQDSKQSRLNHRPILLTLLNQIQISGQSKQSSNKSNRQNIDRNNRNIDRNNNQNITRSNRNNRQQHQKQQQQNKDNELIISDSKQQQQSSVQQLYQQQQHINRQQNNLKDDRQEQSRMKKWKKKMQQGQIDLFSNINNNTHIATKNNIKSNNNNDNITKRNDAKWNYYNNNKNKSNSNINKNNLNKNKSNSNKNSVNSTNTISNSSISSSNNNNNNNSNYNKKYIQTNNIIQLLSDQSSQLQQNHLIGINTNTNAVSKSKRVIKITNNNNNNINNNNNSKNINHNKSININNNKSININKPPTNSNNNNNINNKPINNYLSNNKSITNNNISNNQDHTPLPKQRQPDQRSIIQYFNKNKKSLTINQYPFKSQQKQLLSQSKQRQKNNKYKQHENQHKQHDHKPSLLQIEDHYNQYQNNHNNNNNEQNDYNSPNNNNNNDIDNNNSSQQQKYQLIKSIQQQKRQQQQSGIKILRNSKQISILNINMNNINLHKQIPSNHYQHFFQTKTNSLIN